MSSNILLGESYQALFVGVDPDDRTKGLLAIVTKELFEAQVQLLQAHNLVVKQYSTYDGEEFAKYSSEHTPQVRGPDPANPELYTWQYHPQNTLVDNRFYVAPECTAAAGAHRMAPIVDGRVGKVNADPVRVINLEGADGAYVYSSPASHAPLDHPTPEYKYSTPAEEEDDASVSN